jgi:hypothetical protein
MVFWQFCKIHLITTGLICGFFVKSAKLPLGMCVTHTTKNAGMITMIRFEIFIYQLFSDNGNTKIFF